MIKMICVVDDEDQIRDIMQMWLEENGYDVISIGNPEEAFETIRKNKPRLILLDITMPKKDGLSVLRELKFSPETRSIPVIMLTGKKESEAIETARKLGAADYFFKPFEADAFLTAINQVMQDSI